MFRSVIKALDGVKTAARAGLEAVKRPALTLWAGNDAGGLGSCENQDDLTRNISGTADQPRAPRAKAKTFFGIIGVPIFFAPGPLCFRTMA